MNIKYFNYTIYRFCVCFSVQLWTVSNYHWYLKQSLKYPATAGDRVAALFWDQELANRLHVVCRSGQYTQYTWGWVTDTSCGVDERDRAIVAVIDGGMLMWGWGGGGGVVISPFQKFIPYNSMSNIYTLNWFCNDTGRKCAVCKLIWKM